MQWIYFIVKNVIVSFKIYTLKFNNCLPYSLMLSFSVQWLLALFNISEVSYAMSAVLQTDIIRAIIDKLMSWRYFWVNRKENDSEVSKPRETG